MQEKMDQWINWVEYDELLAGHHNAPHNLLGLHEFGKGQVFTVYRPEAQKITVTEEWQARIRTGRDTGRQWIFWKIRAGS